jgi:hypothetical protein
VNGLLRVRRGVRAALALGIAASLGANVLHADANVVSRLIAAWPPAALAITVELISRVPVASRSLAALRLVAAASVAGIAAVISYTHMRSVAIAYGEDGLTATIMPLSVDGMAVVASICLVEIARRVRTDAPAAPEHPQVRAEHAPDVGALLPAALQVARRIAPDGGPPSGRALAAALRAEGHGVASRNVGALREAVAARWATRSAG